MPNGQQEAYDRPININYENTVDEKVSAAIDDMFEYHAWTPEQVEQGKKVRSILADAVKVIVANVPPGPDRTVAIRKIREARMDANSAITHGGRY